MILQKSLLQHLKRLLVSQFYLILLINLLFLYKYKIKLKTCLTMSHFIGFLLYVKQYFLAIKIVTY